MNPSAEQETTLCGTAWEQNTENKLLFITRQRKSLHYDWLKAGQFIVNSEFAEFAVEINVRAFENFSVTYEMSNRNGLLVIVRKLQQLRSTPLVVFK